MSISKKDKLNPNLIIQDGIRFIDFDREALKAMTLKELESDIRELIKTEMLQHHGNKPGGNK